MLLHLLFLALIPTSLQTLRIEKIDSYLGYSEINIGKEEIVRKYDIILHIIDPNEILDILNQFNTLIGHIDIDKERKDLLIGEITNIRSKVLTIVPHRYRRGLVNFVGKAFKWLYGTLDDDDRQDIEKHFSVVDGNNHEIIKTVNQQIKINTNYNESISKLKQTIETDRQRILDKFNQIEGLSIRLHSETFFIEQMFKLSTLKEKVETIQQNIASARIGVLHPNLLTNEEIVTYNIDFKKLLNIRTGVATFDNNKIIFAIKLPVDTINANKKLLMPMPNEKNIEIVSDFEFVVEIEQIFYKFEENKSLKELRKSRNCVFEENCSLKKNTLEQMIEIDSTTLIVKNIRSKPFHSTCDERNFTINGNYLFSFNNCTISIKNVLFSNTVSEYKDSFIVPNTNQTFQTEKILTFDDIVLKQESNIKAINELKFHKHLNYSFGSLTILIIIAIIVVLIIIRQKQTKLKVQLNTNVKETKENEIVNDTKDLCSIDKIKKKYGLE